MYFAYEMCIKFSTNTGLLLFDILCSTVGSQDAVNEYIGVQFFSVM